MCKSLPIPAVAKTMGGACEKALSRTQPSRTIRRHPMRSTRFSIIPTRPVRSLSVVTSIEGAGFPR